MIDKLEFLDTTFLIDLRLQNPNLASIIKDLDNKGIHGVPSIVAHEFYFGGFNSDSPDEIKYRSAILKQFSIKEFDKEAAYLGAKIESRMKEKGITVGRADVMIAATILSNGGSAIYTRNVKDFQKIEGLEVITWEGM